MHKLKQLQTSHLILNEIEDSDAEAFFELFTNDAVLEFYDVKKFSTLQDSKDLIGRIQQRFINQQGYRYAIRLKYENKSDKLIGSFGVNRIIQDQTIHHDQNFGVVIGYDLHSDFWGNGYMSEVMSQLLALLKGNLLFGEQINFVIAEVYEGNHRSMALLLKYGFHQVKDNTAEQIRLDLELTSRRIFKLTF